METIKTQSAKLSTGILDNASGEIAPLIMQKNGVIRIKKMLPKRKINNKR